MNLFPHVVITVVTLSTLVNTLLYVSYKKTKHERSKSVELKEFVSDLMKGPAMIAVARVDQSNLLLRSPKNNS